jgi:hypothetical protein
MVVSFYYLFDTLGPDTFGPYYVPRLGGEDSGILTLTAMA